MNSTIKKLIRKLKMYKKKKKKNMVHSVEPLSLSQYLLFISSQVIHHYLYGKKKKRPIIIYMAKKRKDPSLSVSLPSYGFLGSLKREVAQVQIPLVCYN